MAAKVIGLPLNNGLEKIVDELRAYYHSNIEGASPPSNSEVLRICLRQAHMRYTLNGMLKKNASDEE